MTTYHSTCPRHCYGTCGIISHINGNKLTRVLGDPEHGYTQGRLCAKGYALVPYSLDQNRLKYPMKKVRRGSNDWRRISWEEAYSVIAAKILELNLRFGSNLALGYWLGKGNTGFLHQAVKAMFASMGPHTKPKGDICSATGESALLQTIGITSNPDPEEMAEAGLIVLWGANPALTNVNQMKFIYEAREKGAPFILIDPVFTKTAQRADFYLQIKPGTDALLAWAIARIIIEKDGQHHEFLEQRTLGWRKFRTEILKLDLDEVAALTGITLGIIEELADYYLKFQPVANWLGLGCQRDPRGEQTVKAVSSLTALTGDYGIQGGGFYFLNNDIQDFPRLLSQYPEKKHEAILASREIPVNDFADQALQLKDPPVKLLWLTCGNPLAQDHNFSAWRSLFAQMELIITVDLYLTRTALQSDLILPAASFFEEEDLHISFWHHWMSINQKILPSFFETKSDLQIARELTRKLNTLKPGFSDFSAEKEPWEWIKGEFTAHVSELYNLTDQMLLLDHPAKRRKEQLSSSWQYHFAKPQYDGFKAIESEYPYLLFTPQSLLKFHSQYETLDGLNSDQLPLIEISADTAEEHQISEGSKIEIFNDQATLQGKAKINPHLQKNIIVTEQSNKFSINDLLNREEENLSVHLYGSVNFNCKVDIRRLSKYV